MASGDTKTEQMLDVLANGGDASQFSGCCNTKTQTYILGAINRIQNVEDEVEMLENNPDVVDIVATYQDLLNYDTSGLTDKDIIRVLQDSTHNNNSTYYRWNATTSQFDYIGEAGGSDGAQMEIVNLTITGVTQDGVAVLASKYNYEVVDLANANKNVVFKITIPSGSGLPAVGTYQLPLFNYSNDVVGSMSTVNVGGTLYSINFFYDNYDDDVNTGVLSLTRIQTGGITVLTASDANWDSSGGGGDPDSIAAWLLADGWYICDSETSTYINSEGYELGIKALFQVTNNGMTILAFDGISIWFNEVDTTDGHVIVGIEKIDGSIIPVEIYIPDWGYFDTKIPYTNTYAPDSSTVGGLGQLYTDTTTMHTYQCTAIDDTDPNNPIFTWTQRW